MSTCDDCAELREEIDQLWSLMVCHFKDQVTMAIKLDCGCFGYASRPYDEDTSEWTFEQYKDRLKEQMSEKCYKHTHGDE